MQFRTQMAIVVKFIDSEEKILVNFYQNEINLLKIYFHGVKNL